MGTKRRRIPRHGKAWRDRLSHFLLHRSLHLGKVGPVFREGQEMHRPAQGGRARVLPGKEKRNSLRENTVA